MRAAPPLQVLLHRFGLWRGAMAALGALAVGALGAWWVARQPVTAPIGWVAVALAVAAALGTATSLSRIPPSWLRWDGRRWWLGKIKAGQLSGDGLAGKVRVELDLGPWMLLRFEPVDAQDRIVWLPVQRRGLEPQWHALRCAVYGPAPSSVDHEPEH